MSRIQRFAASSVGAKFGMALSGLLLSLFVVAHLAGNLLVFGGRDGMNAYAEVLHDLGPWLWVIRAGLLAVFVVHVWLGIRLRRKNHGARPARYVKEDTVQATYGSRHMWLTGVLLLVFIVLHLVHFTMRWLGETPTLPDGRADVYAMVIAGFRNPLFSIVYLASMAVLGVHLYHGLQSTFQTLGIRHAGYTPAIVTTCRAIAWLVALGFAAIPLTIVLGLVGSDAAA